jgi:hypothetical protein
MGDESKEVVSYRRGLKLVNGARHEAVGVVFDNLKANPGHRINADTVLHFGQVLTYPAFSS